MTENDDGAGEGAEVKLKPLDRRTLVHVVRIAAKMADQDPQRNPVYVEAIDLMATALEEAKISCREDGDYWLVKIPQVKSKQKHV